MTVRSKGNLKEIKEAKNRFEETRGEQRGILDKDLVNVTNGEDERAGFSASHTGQIASQCCRSKSSSPRKISNQSDKISSPKKSSNESNKTSSPRKVFQESHKISSPKKVKNPSSSKNSPVKVGGHTNTTSSPAKANSHSNSTSKAVEISSHPDRTLSPHKISSYSDRTLSPHKVSSHTDKKSSPVKVCSHTDKKSSPVKVSSHPEHTSKKVADCCKINSYNDSSACFLPSSIIETEKPVPTDNLKIESVSQTDNCHHNNLGWKRKEISKSLTEKDWKIISAKDMRQEANVLVHETLGDCGACVMNKVQASLKNSLVTDVHTKKIGTSLNSLVTDVHTKKIGTSLNSLAIDVHTKKIGTSLNSLATDVHTKKIGRVGNLWTKKQEVRSAFLENKKEKLAQYRCNQSWSGKAATKTKGFSRLQSEEGDKSPTCHKQGDVDTGCVDLEAGRKPVKGNTRDAVNMNVTTPADSYDVSQPVVVEVVKSSKLLNVEHVLDASFNGNPYYLSPQPGDQLYVPNSQKLSLTFQTDFLSTENQDITGFSSQESSCDNIENNFLCVKRDSNQGERPQEAINFNLSAILTDKDKQGDARQTTSHDLWQLLDLKRDDNEPHAFEDVSPVTFDLLGNILENAKQSLEYLSLINTHDVNPLNTTALSEQDCPIQEQRNNEIDIYGEKLDRALRESEHLLAELNLLTDDNLRASSSLGR